MSQKVIVVKLENHLGREKRQLEGNEDQRASNSKQLFITFSLHPYLDWLTIQFRMGFFHLGYFDLNGESLLRAHAMKISK